MSSPFDLAQLDKIGLQAREYFFQHVLSWALAAQVVISGCALLLAYQASRAIRAWLTRQRGQYANNPEVSAELAILSGPRTLKCPIPNGTCTSNLFLK